MKSKKRYLVKHKADSLKKPKTLRKKIIHKGSNFQNKKLKSKKILFKKIINKKIDSNKKSSDKTPNNKSNSSDKKLDNPPKKEEQIKKKLNLKKLPDNSSDIKEQIKKKLDNKNDNNSQIVETYEIEIDGAKIKIEIEKNYSGTFYNLYIPEIDVATAALLTEIRDELITITNISMKEIIDPEAFMSIKKKFIEEANGLLKTKMPTITPPNQKFLIGKLIQDMLGLGEIEFLINDPLLEEVVIPSSKEEIRVYHKHYGWLSTNIKIKKEEEIINYSNIIARRVGRQITVLNPLLDAHLVSGDRVNSILYPISTNGNTITIRKFARDPYTIIDLISNQTCSLEIASLLWLAIEYEMNVLISGGTASGKTSLLNACMPFIPPNHRIITVEDTRELMLPEFLYWTPLVTRTPNPEGKGEISMLDLLVNSLRMRPDRIVLGEMRRKEEAMVLFEAMHTGHSVYATVHADSASETISRLINPPLSVPPNLLKAVNLNVIMFRDRRRGIRRISQVAEFEVTDDRADANILYRWIPEQDKIIRHSESSRFFEDLSRHTGMSEAEINKNLILKQKILSTLIKNKIRALADFGKILHMYYVNREELLKIIEKEDFKKILGR